MIARSPWNRKYNRRTENIATKCVDRIMRKHQLLVGCGSLGTCTYPKGDASCVGREFGTVSREERRGVARAWRARPMPTLWTIQLMMPIHKSDRHFNPRGGIALGYIAQMEQRRSRSHLDFPRIVEYKQYVEKKHGETNDRRSMGALYCRGMTFACRSKRTTLTHW